MEERQRWDYLAKGILRTGNRAGGDETTLMKKNFCWCWKEWYSSLRFWVDFTRRPGFLPYSPSNFFCREQLPHNHFQSSKDIYL
jgi:hypothetical protein